MSPSGVFVLVKRAAAADEAGGSNAAAGSSAAAGPRWLGKGCGARVVRELCCTGQHKVANKGARGWCSVVMRLASDTASTCVV